MTLKHLLAERNHIQQYGVLQAADVWLREHEGRYFGGTVVACRCVNAVALPAVPQYCHSCRTFTHPVYK